MPILEVEIVTSHGESLQPGLAQQLADAAGDALGTPPGRTWIRMRMLITAQHALQPTRAERPSFHHALYNAW